MANGLNPEVSFSCLSGVIVRVRERLLLVTDVSTTSVVSHLQSQVKSRCQVMVFMRLVIVLIGQFCPDLIIGHHTSVTNSLSEDYTHLDDHTRQTNNNYC